MTPKFTSKAKNQLKLFVWQGSGVLENWTSGMIAVLAVDHSHALELIEKECSICMQSFPVNDYKVITKPKAFVCWGGA